MDQLLVATPEGVTLRFELAGAGSRSAAVLIDLTLYVAVFLVFLFSTALVASQDSTGMSGFVVGSLLGGAMLGIVLYPFLWSVMWRGQTIGKRLLGIRVVDTSGRPARPGQLFLRSLVFPLELLPVPFLISLGLLFMFFTQKGQRLGDLAAGTLVVRDPLASGGLEPYPRESWSGLEDRRLNLVPADLKRFDLADLGYLRALLGRYGTDPPARRRILINSARHYEERLGREWDVKHASQAAELMRELFLFLREKLERSEREPVQPA